MSDLVSKTELLSWIDNWFEQHRYYHPKSRSENIPYSELKDILNQMPTVYIGGPVHARWIDGEEIEDVIRGKSYCSHCGHSVQAVEITKNAVVFTVGKTDYCPNCGARMDLKEDADASS